MDLQMALAAGGKTHVLFGRNDGGGQRFHRTLDEYVSRQTAKA